MRTVLCLLVLAIAACGTEPVNFPGTGGAAGGGGTGGVGGVGGTGGSGTGGAGGIGGGGGSGVISQGLVAKSNGATIGYVIAPVDRDNDSFNFDVYVLYNPANDIIFAVNKSTGFVADPNPDDTGSFYFDQASCVGSPSLYRSTDDYNGCDTSLVLQQVVYPWGPSGLVSLAIRHGWVQAPSLNISGPQLSDTVQASRRSQESVTCTTSGQTCTVPLTPTTIIPTAFATPITFQPAP